MLNSKMALKASSYLSGPINDIIFMVCEIIKNLMKIEEKESTIEFVLTEDQDNWYFNISSDRIPKISSKKIYLLKRLTISIENIEFRNEEDKIQLVLKKV